MDAVEHPEDQNASSREDKPRTPKKILKHIHTRLRSRPGSRDDDHRDPQERGRVMDMVRRACQKLHFGKEGSIDDNGRCRYEWFQDFQRIIKKETTKPISEQESKIINKALATMSVEQANIVESLCDGNRQQPPDYTDGAGGEAEASGPAAGPSRQGGSASSNANIAEQSEQARDVAASGSATRPSRRAEPGSHDTNVAEHAGNAEHVALDGEVSGPAPRPSGQVGSNAQDTNTAEHAVHAEQGRGAGEASGAASRSSRREGSGSYHTNVTEYLENVELAGREGETRGSTPRLSGQVGVVAVHVEYAEETPGPSSGPPTYSASVPRATNRSSLQGGIRAAGSGPVSRPPRRVTFGSHEGDGAEAGERSGITRSIGKLVKRVRGKLHIS
ncbi:hypothetical protein MMC34_000686 [Xylographa carneopallida]|nr:hypothetical protein [Xylographa carneopallida]